MRRGILWLAAIATVVLLRTGKEWGMSRVLVLIVSATLAMVVCALAVGLGTHGSIEAAVCGPSWSTVPSPSQVSKPSRARGHRSG